jgi:hypothetical protein
VFKKSVGNISFLIVAAALLSGLAVAGEALGAQHVASAVSGFDGDWVMSTTRSSIGQPFTERTHISHKDRVETFESEIGEDRSSSGIRYSASIDGKPASFYDRVTGQKRGTVTVKVVSPTVSYIALVEDDPRRGSRWLEHWLSKDGRTYISLLKNEAGVVKSVLIFEKQQH